MNNAFIEVPAINCSFLSSLSKSKRSTLDSSGGLKQLQRRQRSSSPAFASAHELLRAERTIVEPRPSEDEMSGKKFSSSCYWQNLMGITIWLSFFFRGKKWKLNCIISMLSETAWIGCSAKGDASWPSCLLLHVVTAVVFECRYIVPGCGHVVQLAGQWNHFARDPLDALIMDVLDQIKHMCLISRIRCPDNGQIYFYFLQFLENLLKYTGHADRIKRGLPDGAETGFTAAASTLHGPTFLSPQSSPGKCSAKFDYISHCLFYRLSFVSDLILTREVIDE